MAKHKKSKSRYFEGLPVVDGTEDIALTITPADIAGSKKKNPAECAAARAGHRTLHREVRVFLTRTYVKDKKRWLRYLTPERTSREIVAFDRGSAFEPGDYVVKAPAKSQRLGADRGTSTQPKTGAKRQNPRHVTASVRRMREDA